MKHRQYPNPAYSCCSTSLASSNKSARPAHPPLARHPQPWSLLLSHPAPCLSEFPTKLRRNPLHHRSSRMTEPQPEPQLEFTNNADLISKAKDVVGMSDAFLDGSDGTNWEAVETDSDVLIWRGADCVHCPSEWGTDARPFKTQGLVKGVDPEVLVRYLTSIEMKWKSGIEKKPELKIVESVDHQTTVWFERRHFPRPIWDREYCFLERWEPRGEGHFRLSLESIEHPDQPPSIGWNGSNAYVILRCYAAHDLVSDGNGNTKYTLAIEFNAGGALPGMLVDGFLKDMGKACERFSEFFASEDGKAAITRVQAELVEAKKDESFPKY